MPSASEMMMLENTTDGILKRDKHCASGEKAAVKSTIMTALSFGTLWMRISPRWVMLSEGHLEQSS